MKVLKFGGTSLGDANRMKAVADIAVTHQPVLVVLSAVSGTTDSLVKIVELLKRGEQFKVNINLKDIAQTVIQRSNNFSICLISY